jgi:flagellar basal body-associated protein FliL
MRDDFWILPASVLVILVLVGCFIALCFGASDQWRSETKGTDDEPDEGDGER